MKFDNSPLLETIENTENIIINIIKGKEYFITSKNYWFYVELRNNSNYKKY